MLENITTEQLEKELAARKTAQAATDMQRAASSISDTMDRHRMYLDEWIVRFECTVKEMRESPNAGVSHSHGERDKNAVFVALCEIARQWVYSTNAPGERPGVMPFKI